MKGSGRLKKWGFPSIDWDQLLKEGKVPIYKFALELMNETELVEILRIGGYRVDRSYNRDELAALLLRIGKGRSVQLNKPTVDRLRDRLIYLYQVHSAIIRDQLPPYCEFQCYEHPDLMVLGCYALNKAAVDKTWNERR